MRWRFPILIPVAVLVGLCPLGLCLNVCRAEQASSPNRLTQAIGKVLGEDVLCDNVVWVSEHCASLPDEERYDSLADWVLPSKGHTEIRLSGGFLGTDAVSDERPSHVESTSNLVSPTFDLLDIARKLNRLPALSERLATTPPSSSSEQQRARVALQLLLTLEMNGNSVDIERDASALSKLLLLAPLRHLKDVWPETLVVVRGMQQPSPHEAMGDLINLIKSRGSAPEVPLGSGFEAWHDLIFVLGRQNFIRQSHPQQSLSDLVADTHLTQWQSIPRQRGYSRGSGYPRSMWMWDGTQIEHVSGHEEDYLFYQCPLLGDFALDFDVPSDSQTQIFAGGNLLGPNWGTQLCYGDLRSGAVMVPLTPPLNHLESWVHCRVEFQGETRTLSLNGRRVRTDALTGPRYPWLASHSWSRNEGRIRDVRITGSPIIPNSVPLSASAELTGWHSYQEATVGFPNASWSSAPPTDADASTSGEIVGQHQPWLAGSHCERLLVYQRPLLENGTVEYDFFYAPGRVMAFPALDRTAFLIEPDQLSLHQITDDKFDRRELSPDNAEPLPRGEKPLPLKANDWNRMRLAVVDHTVSLTLNGEQIHEHELEPTNTRQFGLWHFADQTEARVRNVVMWGDWPRALPSLAQQELANSSVPKLEAEIGKLKTVFHHNFSAGIPEKYFSIPPGDPRGNIELNSEGLKCVQESPGPVSKSFVRPHFEVRGNFDVSIHFKDWQSSNHDFCGASLEMVAQSGHRFAVTRRVQNKDYHWAVLEWGIPKGNGELTSYYQTVTTEATEGHLRVVRLGDVWHALFADNNTSVYRVIATVPLEGTESSPVTLNMATVAGETGRTQLIWKGIRVAAEELMLLPDASQAPKLSVATMKVDGTELRRLSRPESDDPGHGSPDWSPDGKQIVFDSWRGGAAASHLFLVNAEGTNLRYLGAGAMPTFSPDGEQLAFSGEDGMSIMKSDGTNRKVIAVSGWGAQWSPHGQWISYGDYQSGNGVSRGNIAITDIKTKQTRHLLEGEHAARYSNIYWNMEWSPNSKQICFKGGLSTGGTELAMTDVAGSSHGFQILTNQSVESDISWHPDGKSILVSMPSPQHAGAVRLFVCELATKTLTYLESQPVHSLNTSAAWSPDGTRIAFITLFPIEPILWKAAHEN